MVAIDAQEVVQIETLRLQCEIDHEDHDLLLRQYAQAALDYCLYTCDEPSIDTAAKVPVRMTQAALMLVAHWFANREAVVTGTITAQVPLAVESLLFTCRNFYGAALPEA
jgi:uncharacterized phage protein (predicted DNA packaging)